MKRTWRRYSSESTARAICRAHNYRHVESCIVEGPEGGVWYVMPIGDAIREGFLYSWDA